MSNQGYETEKSRPHTIFKPATRKPNFIVSVLITTVRLFAVLLVVFAVVGVGLVLGVVKAYTETAPELNLAQIDDQAQTSFFYDADNNLITDYKGTEDRVMVSIDEIPLTLQNAFIGVEDARFRSHNGIDPKRILGAFVSNLSSSSTQGGSTITQQLVKKTMLSDEQNYKRKIQEAYLAMQLERINTKDQILESYLNTIYLGESYYGIKTAAYGYFGKELEELTLRECAMLAGIARSPYYYNPRRNFYMRETPEVSNVRTDYALKQMYENQFITYDEYEAALSPATANVLAESPNSSSTLYDYPYYVEYAIQDVINALLSYYSLEDTSSNRTLMGNKLRTGGYHITLCIDTEIQQIVEDTLANWNNYPALRDPDDAIYQQRNADGTYVEIIQPQAAAAIVDYRTGEVKAVVGGRTAPTARKTLNRATDMTMPVGSSIKPISVYAPAIDQGASPASIVYNMPVPIHGWNDGTGKDYYPSNYGGGSFTGPTTFRRAMRQSYNTGAAQALMYFVGVDYSAQYLRAMGIDDANINADAFGLALGSSGITPVQMAVAFGTLANGGVYQQPIAFESIKDADGNTLIDRASQQERRVVFKESTAWAVVDMLKEAVASGTGKKAQISGQTVGGKTGTNSDYKGVSFAGMTGWYSGSVWIGHDNYKALSSKATGGDYAAPLWQAIMDKIHQAKDLSDRDIIEKDAAAVGLQKVTTCGVSGMLATNACANDVNGYGTVTDYWASDSMPTEYCNMHQELPICSETGMLATEYCPYVETKSVVILPIGHPLYDFIDEYQSTLRQYLGEFATLKLSADNDEYNQQLTQSVTCTLHSAYSQQDNYGWYGSDSEFNDSGATNYQSSVDNAAYLVETAYRLVGERGGELSGESYGVVVNAIRQVEGIVNGTGSGNLDEAVQALQFALTVFN